MPDFTPDDIDVNPSEFVDACSSRERQELIDYLVECGFISEDQKDIKTPNPFDVAGCRYDLKESNQLHETIYGAPLDSCMAYQSANVAGTGTVFYPLNAF